MKLFNSDYISILGNLTAKNQCNYKGFEMLKYPYNLCSCCCHEKIKKAESPGFCLLEL